MINDINFLQDIRREIKKRPQKKKSEMPAFMEAVKPIRTDVSLVQLKKEKNYKPVSYSEIRKIIGDMEWSESLDELLEILKK